MLPLLSAVTIIVMVTDICRGQSMDDREPEHLESWPDGSGSLGGNLQDNGNNEVAMGS